MFWLCVEEGNCPGWRELEDYKLEIVIHQCKEKIYFIIRHSASDLLVLY